MQNNNLWSSLLPETQVVIELWYNKQVPCRERSGVSPLMQLMPQTRRKVHSTQQVPILHAVSCQNVSLSRCQPVKI